MKGDFSRLPFDPSKHYNGVLHQQGRVWLDSDWNEEVAQRLALLQQELRDLVGPCGVPNSATFQISASLDNRPDNFQISGGHGYVNGLLCAIDNSVSYLSQPDYPDAPRITIPTDGSTVTALVYLEVWHRLITFLEDDSIREVALGGPDTSTRLKTITQVKTVPINNGITKCSDAASFLPGESGGRLTTLQPAVNPALTLCQLPDPANYTGRENRLYRVEVHDPGDVAGSGQGSAFRIGLGADAAAGATSVTLTAALTREQAIAARQSGFVTISDANGVSERVPIASINPALTVITLGQPLTNGYTRANRAGLSGGVARFKWSRDNASFAVRVTNVKSDRVSITLASLGRDLASALRQGDVVELCDDASELGPARGHLTFLKSDPDPDLLTVQLQDALPASFVLNGESSDRHLLLRRWDGVGDAAVAFDAAGTPAMNLGDGVRIQFSGEDLAPGDYWLFATRAADGSVEALSNAPPFGIRRHRCPLAIVTWGPPPPTSPPASPPAGVAMTVVQDCRRVFPALIDFPAQEKGFRITSISSINAANAATALGNDTDLHVDAFAGIDVACDAPPDPASVSRPTCYVSAEFPVIAGSPAAVWYFPVNLAGSVSVDTTRMIISWRALPQTQSLLSDAITSSPNERGVLARLTLKGQFIWALNNPSLFLDGEAFGQRQAGTNNTALQLPTGDRRKGGDFEMWFWIVAAPSFSKLIAAAPAQIYIGETATVTVTLSSSAPPGGGNATVTSSSPAVATVPATISVAAGANSFQFNVTGANAGATTITVNFGAPPAPPSTTLTVLALPLLTGQVSISPVSILIGATATASITLDAPAPSAGAVVTLRSSNAAVAALTVANVTVPAGATNASFGVRGAAAGSATITAVLTWPNGSTSNVSGSITVRAKGKDKDKETKEAAKDTADKRLQLEKLDKTTLETKTREVKIREVISPQQPAVLSLSGTSPSNGTARSFIRPEERPAVDRRVMEASRLEKTE